MCPMNHVRTRIPKSSLLINEPVTTLRFPLAGLRWYNDPRSTRENGVDFGQNDLYLRLGEPHPRVELPIFDLKTRH